MYLAVLSSKFEFPNNTYHVKRFFKTIYKEKIARHGRMWQRAYRLFRGTDIQPPDDFFNYIVFDQPYVIFQALFCFWILCNVDNDINVVVEEARLMSTMRGSQS